MRLVPFWVCRRKKNIHLSSGGNASRAHPLALFALHMCWLAMGLPAPAPVLGLLQCLHQHCIHGLRWSFVAAFVLFSSSLCRGHHCLVIVPCACFPCHCPNCPHHCLIPIDVVLSSVLSPPCGGHIWAIIAILPFLPIVIPGVVLWHTTIGVPSMACLMGHRHRRWFAPMMVCPCCWWWCTACYK
jgi:hypothetical protein